MSLDGFGQYRGSQKNAEMVLMMVSIMETRRNKGNKKK